jgi:hypothetical protein
LDGNLFVCKSFGSAAPSTEGVVGANVLGQIRLAYGAGRRLWWFGSRKFLGGVEVVWRKSEGDVACGLPEHLSWHISALFTVYCFALDRCISCHLSYIYAYT